MEITVGNPYLAQFNLTNRCIFDCQYCYLKAAGLKPSSLLEYSRFKAIINKLAKAGSFYDFDLQIDITGGDIWLIKDIESYLSLLISEPKVKGVGLMLNSLWHPKAKDSINLVKPKLTLVQLNIDSMKDHNEDIGYLINKNIRTVIKILISNDKLYFNNQIRIAKELLKKYPKLLISFDRLTPSDQDQTKNISSYNLYQEQFHKIKQIADKNLITDDPFTGCGMKNITRSDDSIHGCAIPGSGITVFPDGSVKLCARIPQFDTKFNIENFSFTSYLKKFNKINSQKNKKCSGCVFESACGGGCPATSYVKSGKITRDIHCSRSLRKSKYFPFIRYRIPGSSYLSCVLVVAGCFGVVTAEETVSELKKETDMAKLEKICNQLLKSKNIQKRKTNSDQIIAPSIIPVYYNNSDTHIAVIGKNSFGMCLVYNHQLRHPIWMSQTFIKMISLNNMPAISFKLNEK